MTTCLDLQREATRWHFLPISAASSTCVLYDVGTIAHSHSSTSLGLSAVVALAARLRRVPLLVDASSVRPVFRFSNPPSSEEPYDSDTFADSDAIVQMAPRRRFFVTVEVSAVTRGRPTSVAP